MNSPTPEEVAEKSLSVESALKSAQTAPTKIEFDAERIRSSVARLASNSVDDLEKLTSELQQLQDFLKSETERVQHQIGDVLAGIEIIIETIAPWKTTGVPSAQHTNANGRDRLKRWP